MFRYSSNHNFGWSFWENRKFSCFANKEESQEARAFFCISSIFFFLFFWNFGFKDNCSVINNRKGFVVHRSILSEAFQIFAAFSSRKHFIKLSDNTISSFYAPRMGRRCEKIGQKMVWFFDISRRGLIFSTQKDNQQQKGALPLRGPRWEKFLAVSSWRRYSVMFSERGYILLAEDLSLEKNIFAVGISSILVERISLCTGNPWERKMTFPYHIQIFPCTLFSVIRKKSFVSFTRKPPFSDFGVIFPRLLYAFEEFFCHIV